MKKKRVFIACDTNSVAKIKNIITKSNNKKIKFGYKIGLEFFLSAKGRDFVSKLKNKEYFLMVSIILSLALIFLSAERTALAIYFIFLILILLKPVFSVINRLIISLALLVSFSMLAFTDNSLKEIIRAEPVLDKRMDRLNKYYYNTIKLLKSLNISNKAEIDYMWSLPTFKKHFYPIS